MPFVLFTPVADYKWQYGLCITLVQCNLLLTQTGTSTSKSRTIYVKLLWIGSFRFVVRLEIFVAIKALVLLWLRSIVPLRVVYWFYPLGCFFNVCRKWNYPWLIVFVMLFETTSLFQRVCRIRDATTTAIDDLLICRSRPQLAIVGSSMMRSWNPDLMLIPDQDIGFF